MLHYITQFVILFISVFLLTAGCFVCLCRFLRQPQRIHRLPVLLRPCWRPLAAGKSSANHLLAEIFLMFVCACFCPCVVSVWHRIRLPIAIGVFYLPHLQHRSAPPRRKNGASGLPPLAAGARGARAQRPQSAPLHYAHCSRLPTARITFCRPAAFRTLRRGGQQYIKPETAVQ